jgi:hypothetical protein
MHHLRAERPFYRETVGWSMSAGRALGGGTSAGATLT